MTAKEIVIIGAGGHAKSCIEVIESTGEYSIAQVVGQESDLGLHILGHEVRHTDADLVNLKEKYDDKCLNIVLKRLVDETFEW